MDTSDSTASAITGADSSIELELPARTDMAATLRVVVASLGADVGLTLDEIDDVRLAVNEVFASVADDHAVAGRFGASFVPADGHLSVSLRLLGGDGLVLDQLARTILESVVSDLVVADDAVSFSKRAHEATG